MTAVTRAYDFFLGGHDLEMKEISLLVEKHQGRERLHDKSLSWGAKASDYLEDIKASLKARKTLVLIELEDDLPASMDRSRIGFIDHHGLRAGADNPSALRQVFDLLKLPEAEWTRRLELVETNDIGHIRAMRGMGASAEEIREIRLADLEAQGMTPAQLEEARRAVAARETIGPLTIVETLNPTSSATGDYIEPEFGGPGASELLVFSSSGVSFFGSGAIVRDLHERFGGWYGGALPARGYWGLGSGNEAHRNKIRQSVVNLLT